MTILIMAGLAIGTIFFAILISKIYKNYRTYALQYEELEKKLKDRETQAYSSSKKPRFFFNYAKTEDYIKSSGADYIFQGKLTPLTYWAVKIGLAFVLALVLIPAYPMLSIPGALVGFFCLDFFLYISNEADNEDMLLDIRDVYNTLQLQTKAGVFMTSSFLDCYLTVRNDRLKQAFLDLNADLNSHVDLNDALDRFNSKFSNNLYITTLVVTIRQAQRSGKAAAMFDDVAKQMQDIQSALNIKEKAKLETQAMVIQFLIYGFILMFILYCAFSAIQANMGEF